MSAGSPPTSPVPSANSNNNPIPLQMPAQIHSRAAATETPGKTLAPLRSTSTSPAATLRYRAETFFLLQLGELFLYDCPFASLDFYIGKLLKQLMVRWRVRAP